MRKQATILAALLALLCALPVYAGDITIFVSWCKPLPGSVCTKVDRTDGQAGDVPLTVIRCPETGQTDFVCDYVVPGWVSDGMDITAFEPDWMVEEQAVDNIQVSWELESASVIPTTSATSAFQLSRPSVALAQDDATTGSDWIKTAVGVVSDGDLHVGSSPCSGIPSDCRGRLLRLIVSRCNGGACATGNAQVSADLVMFKLSVSE